MQQVLRRGLKDIVVDEVPDPVVAPHHVLIRSWYSLISSGTETASIHAEGVLKTLADNPSHLRTLYNALQGAGPRRTAAEVRAKFAEYAVLGYSGAGVVHEIHPTVSDLAVGDRVAYGGEGTGHGETIHAGRQLVVRLPEDVSFEHGCFTTLGSIALNAVRTAGVGLGDTVAVIGLGIVGQLVAQLARLQGAVVIGVDLRGERVELARRLGATQALLASGPVREEVSALTGGRGADCVIVAAAAKSPAPAVQALRLCRERGRLVIVGAVELSLPWHEMYLKEIQLFMSRAYGPGSYDPVYEKTGRDYPITYVRWTENRNMEEFVRLMAAGAVHIEPLVSHCFPLAQAPAAYSTILDGASNSLAVLLRYPETQRAASSRPWSPRRRIEVAPRPHDEREIGVAVAGAGNIARWHHIPAVRALPDVTLRAIFSASGARGKSYARRFGAEYCCSDYEEILRDPGVHVVLILTRHQHHAAQALAALQAGKHVFVEKPMALTEDECRALVRAVKAGGGQITVGFNRRFAPFYVEAKRALARRTTPVVLHCRVSSPGISGAYWMADPSIGGAILGEACHFVDLMAWLLEAEPVSVAAYALPAANNLVASFRFADGSVGNLTYCTLGSARGGGERVEAFGPGLTVRVEDFKRLTVETTRRRRRAQWWPEKGYAAQLQAFLGSVRAGTPPAVTVRDGARATLACLAMLESARTLEPRPIDVGALFD
ncbi:MAG TPA: bi-domain-containing oxidoreductase [Methylomirabilota bacterium]|jgi:predicted dehydrogenase/threonine dehydrogenase-like Zn-dependent dehydrogenase